MQLRAYLLILRRFWPLILLLPALAGAISLGLSLRQPARPIITARLMVSHSLLDAGRGASLPDFNTSYSWTTSEFVLDDLPQVVASVAFAQDVRANAAAAGYSLDPGAVEGRLQAAVLHRSVYLSLVADTVEQGAAILRGAVEALQTRGLDYWGRGAGGLDVAVIDPPRQTGTVGGVRDAIVSAGLRAALGLAAAVGLALLLHYLDDRLRSRDQAEQWTGAQVIASIPKE